VEQLIWESVMFRSLFIMILIIIITRSIIVSEMTKSQHRHYRRFRERMTEEMGLQMFPETDIDTKAKSHYVLDKKNSSYFAKTRYGKLTVWQCISVFH